MRWILTRGPDPPNDYYHPGRFQFSFSAADVIRLLRICSRRPRPGSETPEASAILRLIPLLLVLLLRLLLFLWEESEEEVRWALVECA